MDKPTIAFILGSPRSGTTLVQQLIATSNEVHTIGETHLIHKARYLKSKNYFKRIFSVLLINFTYFKLGFREFFLTTNQKNFYARLNTNFVKQLKLRNKRLFLEKTPRHLYYFNEINKNLPSSKFIFILRNPIDNAKSLLSSSNKWNDFLRDNEIEHAQSRWLYDLNLILKYKNYKNTIVLYYDKLTHQKYYQDEINKIENFLNIKINIQELSSSSNKIIKKNESWKKNNFSNTILFKNNLKNYQLMEALIKELSKIDES